MTDAEMTDLLAWVADSGFATDAFDLVVYDLTNEHAADLYNGGEDETAPVIAGETDAQAYERLHGDADRQAAAINAGGIEAQIAYLLTWHDEAAGIEDFKSYLGQVAGGDRGRIPLRLPFRVTSV